MATAAPSLLSLLTHEDQRADEVQLMKPQLSAAQLRRHAACCFGHPASSPVSLAHTARHIPVQLCCMDAPVAGAPCAGAGCQPQGTGAAAGGYRKRGSSFFDCGTCTGGAAIKGAVFCRAGVAVSSPLGQVVPPVHVAALHVHHSWSPA